MEWYWMNCKWTRWSLCFIWNVINITIISNIDSIWFRFESYWLNSFWLLMYTQFDENGIECQIESIWIIMVILITFHDCHWNGFQMKHNGQQLHLQSSPYHSVHYCSIHCSFNNIPKNDQKIAVLFGFGVTQKSNKKISNTFKFLIK